MLLFIAGGEHKVSERQKGDKRHIVRHDHRAEVCNKDERKRNAAHIAERHNDLAGKPFKKMALLQGADNGERTKQTGQRIKIEITGIIRVGRNEKTSHRRRYDRNEQNDMASDLLCDQARKNMLTRMNGFLHERSFSEGNLRYPLYTFCAKKASGYTCRRRTFVKKITSSTTPRSRPQGRAAPLYSANR